MIISNITVHSDTILIDFASSKLAAPLLIQRASDLITCHSFAQGSESAIMRMSVLAGSEDARIKYSPTPSRSSCGFCQRMGSELFSLL